MPIPNTDDQYVANVALALDIVEKVFNARKLFMIEKYESEDALATALTNLYIRVLRAVQGKELIGR